MFEHNTAVGSVPEGKGLIGALFYNEWTTTSTRLRRTYSVVSGEIAAKRLPKALGS